MKKHILTIVSFIVLVTIFVFIALAVKEKSFGFDMPFLEFLSGLRNSFFTNVFELLSVFADTKTVIVICAILIFIPWTRYNLGVPLSIAALITALIGTLVKGLIERTRPPEELWLVEVDTYSFPSGHSTAGLVVYFFLGFLIMRFFYSKKLYFKGYISIILAILLIAGIALSRLYLGVHYPSDVIGGLLLGSSLLIFFITVYDAIYPEKYIIKSK